MRRLLTLIALVFILGSGSALAQCDFEGAATVHDGFLSGQDLVEYSDGDLGAYVMGFVNGVFLAPMMDAPESCAAMAVSCVEGMNNIQLAAILRKYLNENPETWHEGAHMLTYRALFGRCMFPA